MGREAAIPEIWPKSFSGISPQKALNSVLEMSEILQNLSKIPGNSQKISFFM